MSLQSNAVSQSLTVHKPRISPVYEYFREDWRLAFGVGTDREQRHVLWGYFNLKMLYHQPLNSYCFNITMLRSWYWKDSCHYVTPYQHRKGLKRSKEIKIEQFQPDHISYHYTIMILFFNTWLTTLFLTFRTHHGHCERNEISPVQHIFRWLSIKMCTEAEINIQSCHWPTIDDCFTWMWRLNCLNHYGNKGIS